MNTKKTHCVICHQPIAFCECRKKEESNIFKDTLEGLFMALVLAALLLGIAYFLGWL